MSFSVLQAIIITYLNSHCQRRMALLHPCTCIGLGQNCSNLLDHDILGCHSKNISLGFVHILKPDKSKPLNIGHQKCTVPQVVHTKRTQANNVRKWTVWNSCWQFTWRPLSCLSAQQPSIPPHWKEGAWQQSCPISSAISKLHVSWAHQSPSFHKESNTQRYTAEI